MVDFLGAAAEQCDDGGTNCLIEPAASCGDGTLDLAADRPWSVE